MQISRKILILFAAVLVCVFTVAMSVAAATEGSESYDATAINRILAVDFPAADKPQVFAIRASSEIHEFGQMFLNDNRLVLDFPNSTTELHGTLAVPEFAAVRGIRASQFEAYISRVVFDLRENSKFSVDLSDDRTAVLVTIYAEDLGEIEFEASEEYDSIRLSNVSLSSLRVRPTRDGIRVYLYNTRVSEGLAKPLDGEFAIHMSVTAANALTGILEVELSDFVAWEATETEDGNAVIRLRRAGYSNIWYDFDSQTLRIPRLDGLDFEISEIEREDLYSRRQLVLTLPTCAAELLGYGEMFILDDLLDSVTVESCEESGNTRLMLNGARIFTAELYTCETYFRVRLMLPSERYSRILVVDPGHGGRDPGAVRGEFRESEFNLAISLKLRQLLERYSDVRVYMTRDSDVSLGLAARAELANEVGGIFISVHHNAANNVNAHGVETYFFNNPNETELTSASRDLARVLHRNLLEQTERNDREVRSANFSVLRNSTVPAALVEVGFMSNRYELVTLASVDYQWRAAVAMFYGVLEMFDTIEDSLVAED